MEIFCMIILALAIYFTLHEEMKKEIERVEINRMNMEKIIFNRLEELEKNDKVYNK